MSNTKYVIIDELYPVMFSSAMKHSQFKNLGNITSAGFCDIGIGEDGDPIASAYGESFSLKVKSKKEDSDIITRSIINPYL